MATDKEILVTINCITYNQHDYIRQALDSFLMQKTNFRFIISVHDDASTDGTQDIVSEYANKYPDLIKATLEKENQYSKHDGSFRRIIDSLLQGKYIAFCEGDDYWTDPYKLQKQVDFLEANPDYSMCFHNAIMHYENNIVPDRKFANIENRDYTDLEIYEKWITSTASVLLRHDVYSSPQYNKMFYEVNPLFGDIPLFLVCSMVGKIRGMEDTMCVYRRHDGNITRVQKKGNATQMMEYAKSHIRIYKAFGDRYKNKAVYEFVRIYTNLFIYSRQEGNIKWGYLITALKEDFLCTLECLFDSAMSSIKRRSSIIRQKYRHPFES